MMTRKRAAREARQLFHLCLVDGTLDEGRVRKVVQTVLQSRRRGYLLLLDYFRRFVRLDLEDHVAQVESAVVMPDDLQENVRTRLHRLYGPGTTTLFSLNPALIGGMRIQIGSDVYDGSVQYRLDTLRRSFGIDSRDEETNRSYP
jgi:F-type H+-transporting ATPase subunit delta